MLFFQNKENRKSGVVLYKLKIRPYAGGVNRFHSIFYTLFTCKRKTVVCAYDYTRCLHPVLHRYAHRKSGSTWAPLQIRFNLLTGVWAAFS